MTDDIEIPMMLHGLNTSIRAVKDLSDENFSTWNLYKGDELLGRLHRDDDETIGDEKYTFKGSYELQAHEVDEIGVYITGNE